MDGHWFLVFGVWNPAVDRLPQTHQLAQTPKSISAFVKLPLRVSYISNKSDPDECIVQREREKERLQYSISIDGCVFFTLVGRLVSVV